MKSRSGEIRILLCLIAAFGMALSFQATAATYAMLVGVSAYPTLPEERRLNGPRNDVVLLHELLRESGVAENHIHVLADGVAGAALPTHARILSEFMSLAKEAKRGDWVVVYFAGHGTQQPQPPGSPDPEPDGLDEVFLPYDIGRWESVTKKVRNGLIDDDVGLGLESLLENGARVWAIFDTCHAGDMSKVADARRPVTVWRSVPPSDLGIEFSDDMAPVSVRERVKMVDRRAGAQDRKRKLVLFYAAQSDEPAGEERLGEQSDRSNGGDWHGVFSYRLAEAMRSNPKGSLSEWGRAILARYRKERRPFPHPYFVGNLEQRPLANGRNELKR